MLVTYRVKGSIEYLVLPTEILQNGRLKNDLKKALKVLGIDEKDVELKEII